MTKDRLETGLIGDIEKRDTEIVDYEKHARAKTEVIESIIAARP